MDISLSQKRNDLARRMESYRSLPEYILDGIGALFQCLFAPAARTRGTFLSANASEQENEGFPSYWMNGLTIALFSFLIGWLVTLASGTRLNADETQLTLWAVLIPPASCAGLRHCQPEGGSQPLQVAVRPVTRNQLPVSSNQGSVISYR